MGDRTYYTTHGHDGISRVWVKESNLAPNGMVFARLYQNKGGAELIRKLLQDHEDACDLKEAMARQEEEDQRRRNRMIDRAADGDPGEAADNV